MDRQHISMKQEEEARDANVRLTVSRLKLSCSYEITKWIGSIFDERSFMRTGNKKNKQYLNCTVSIHVM